MWKDPFLPGYKGRPVLPFLVHYWDPSRSNAYNEEKAKWEKTKAYEGSSRVPRYRADWPEGHDDLLRAAMEQGGVTNEALREHLLKAARRGLVPEDPRLLSSRLTHLFQIRDPPDLDKEQLLSNQPSVLLEAPTSLVKKLQLLKDTRGRVLFGHKPNNRWQIKNPGLFLKRQRELENAFCEWLKMPFPKSCLMRKHNLFLIEPDKVMARMKVVAAALGGHACAKLLAVHPLVFHTSESRLATRLQDLKEKFSLEKKCEVASLVLGCPTLLCMDTGVIRRKIKAIMRLMDLDEPDVVKLVAEEPTLIRRRNLKDKMEVLQRGWELSHTEVVSVVRRVPRLLTNSTDALERYSMRVLTQLCNQLALSPEAVQQLVLRHPYVLQVSDKELARRIEIILRLMRKVPAIGSGWQRLDPEVAGTCLMRQQVLDLVSLQPDEKLRAAGLTLEGLTSKTYKGVKHQLDSAKVEPRRRRFL